MHEMSIAQSIWELARKRVPAGAMLRRVHVRAGPLRALDPESMQWAWDALSAEAGASEVRLDLATPPWTMRCADCNRQWESSELADRCACGSHRVEIIGGDELQLTSIEVDDAPQLAVPGKKSI